MYLDHAPQPSRRTPMDALYKTVGVETNVNGADPHKLVSLLFDGFFEATNQAKFAMSQGDVPAKCKLLTKAVRIIDEGLKAGLDLRAGVKLAEDLQSLYAYVSLRLTQANYKNDAAIIDECQRLIAPLRDAWQSIRGQV